MHTGDRHTSVVVAEQDGKSRARDERGGRHVGHNGGSSSSDEERRADEHGGEVVNGCARRPDMRQQRVYEGKRMLIATSHVPQAQVDAMRLS
jgi:hypothetical protein